MSDTILSDSLVNALLIGAQIAAIYLGILWLCVVYWAYRDARRRTTDRVLAVASAALVLFFFVPGYWLYLIVRPRLTMNEAREERAREVLLAEFARHCPSCSAHVSSEYVVCPRCRTRLKSMCASCAKPVEANWIACAYCTSLISTDSPSANVATNDVPIGEPVHA